uniref:Fizzy-related protein homolog n=1 Tax=Caenorhabditis japonica TaxID=281687 RepID=A0A8R1DEJ6_CAEJA
MDAEQQPPAMFHAPTIVPTRRTLGPHNSPVKSLSQVSSAHTSPRVTPTKGANPYGDRFMPLRQSNHDWNSRYNSISAEDDTGFKKPMGACNRHIGGGIQNIMATSSTSASSSTSSSALNASSSSHHHHHHHYHYSNPTTPSQAHDYYQGTSSGSGSTSPTGQGGAHNCLDDSRSGEAVLRALLRNEMLKDRIDDVKQQVTPLDEQLSTYTLAPVVAAFPATVGEPGVVGPAPQGIIPQLERNAYGGSVDSVFPVMADGVNDTTRISTGFPMLARLGAISPTVAEMMEPRLRGGSEIPMDTSPSPAGSVCGDTPTRTPTALPLSPIPIKQSPARALFAYSAKTTPIKAGGQQPVSTSSPFGGPLGLDSQRLLRTPRKPTRKVPKNPYKVLDAPELQDDFYLNLVDWSSQNQLSVGLSSCVYLWSATTSQVIKLCDLSTGNDQDNVTSVQWCDKGDLLAVGTNRGIVQIWDVTTQKKVRDMTGHTSRIGCLAWNADTICSGSRDRTILHRDIRCDDNDMGRKLTTHRQEVCGLKWSPDKQLLASGGNDNQLLVWNLRRDQPVQTYNQHNAAVKALAWSPHHHGLLVSGGGTADRCLRFWNTLTSQPMQSVDTGSQVCNVAWSKHSSELVSTHGYSYNHVIIWKYPSLQPVTKLVGHQYRVLYLAMSPDGESIVTGAGDETLRFWHVFNKGNPPTMTRSKLNLHSTLR